MLVWLSRMLVGLVLTWNLLCALEFLISPAAFLPGFELEGLAGEAVVRGFGVLFLMWNVPYGVAFLNPIRNRQALFEALAMQAIGLAGESWIFTTLPAAHHAMARQTLERFMIFDALGLLALASAAWLTRKS